MQAKAAMNIDRPRRWLVLPVMLLVGVALGLLALVLVKANPAEGAFPSNGRFVFDNTMPTNGNPEGDAEIYTINPDGTDLRQITSNDVEDLQPAWSPDARKIVFVSYRNPYSEIYKMDADGNNLIKLTTGGSQPHPRSDPAWSPDGNQIAFVTDGPDDTEDIFVMDADGNNVRDLTADHAVFGVGNERAPAWSPDGKQIAFVTDRNGKDEIYKMNSDGTSPTRLTNNEGISQFLTDDLPDWSPDGTQIAFTRNRDGNTEIYKMDAVDINGDGNGDNQTRLTFFDTITSLPQWSPDGNQIAFTKREFHNPGLVNVIYTMDANGDKQNLVPNTDANSLDWGVAAAPPPPDTTKPTITINTPVERAKYSQNQPVAADFNCQDETDGSGIKSCVGTVDNGAAIDTSTVGPQTFTVTAEDNAGNKSTLTVNYDVADLTNPGITIRTPAEGAQYTRKQPVTADYECQDASGIKSCVGTVPDGTAIDTSTVGIKTFTVNAEDNAGNKSRLTHTYTVVSSSPAPPPIKPKPPGNIFGGLIVFSSTRATPDNPEGLDDEIFTMDSGALTLSNLPRTTSTIPSLPGRRTARRSRS